MADFTEGDEAVKRGRARLPYGPNNDPHMPSPPPEPRMSERYVVKRTAKAVRIFDRASTFYTLYPKREWPDQDAAEDHAIKTCAEWNAAGISEHQVPTTGAAHE